MADGLFSLPPKEKTDEARGVRKPAHRVFPTKSEVERAKKIVSHTYGLGERGGVGGDGVKTDTFRLSNGA
jgi:hypothetical protein